ncbi:MAG: hypothetical protein QW338_05910 [Conexivisphaerales archaeon]
MGDIEMRNLWRGLRLASLAITLRGLRLPVYRECGCLLAFFEG